MPPTSKPWADVIPAEDLSVFQKAYDPADRPLTAGKHPTLIVVDMTRAFVDDAYPTGWSATGYPAVAATAKMLGTARSAGLPVYFSKGFPDPGHRPTARERGRWNSAGRPELPPGVPPGDVIVDDLAPLPSETVIYKGKKPSAFFGTQLLAQLIYDGADTVIVTGMTTSGCVRATVLDAFMSNLNVVIPFECTADRSQISHKVSLFDLHMKYADVVSLDETVDYVAKLTVSDAARTSTAS